MSEFELHEGLYPRVTNSGAYYAVSSPDENPSRILLRALLKNSARETIDEAKLLQWCQQDNPEQCFDLLYQSQQLGWLEGSEEAGDIEFQNLEQALNEILPNLSSEGKVILSNSEGLYIASAGYAHETAAELAALSADIANLHERHHGLISGNLNLDLSSWGLMDSLGSSRLGFWPLYIGSERFALCISEHPRLNHPDFVRLLTLLSIRYS
ncbi:hypothetical protein [uncultured Pseudoteredinibacter sp.]|uniref:hypothetical protein n=1 Tax=uncultured Pseudoteredinibacter sp. TaxID=1641701 RepID=UPI00262FA695|nr:hypothetical protein [uncultured Pseudoteredinibacter sp.]